MTDDSPGISERAQAGLETAYSRVNQKAELLRAVLEARSKLANQEWIAAETLRRFRQNVTRAEAAAKAAGVSLDDPQC